MQRLSHGTRAYIWNENGLQGFVKILDITAILSAAETSGSLATATEWQFVDMKNLLKCLNDFTTVND